MRVELCWVGNDAEQIEPDQIAKRFRDVAVVRCEQGAFARFLHLVKAAMTIADHPEPIRYGSLQRNDFALIAHWKTAHLISAIGTMSENLRSITDFFKDEIATKPVTSKNKNHPSIYFSSMEDGPGYRLAPPDAA